jgi:hypothetical protein
MGTDHLEFLARLWRHRHDPRIRYTIRIDIWRPLWHFHHHHHHHRYEEHYMSTNPVALTQLTSPGAFIVGLTLLSNGAPFVPEAGSSFVFSPTLAISDTSVVSTPDATVPNQFDITIPAGDTSASVTFTASATDPDGNAIVETLTLPFATVSQAFTISIVVSAAPAAS